MQKSLLAVFFIAILSNCTRTTLEPNGPTAAFAQAQGARKPYTRTIVILGSSTAEGLGASDYKHSWAGLLSNKFSLGRVINLAKRGYTSYNILPTEFPGPSSRPKVDTLRNLTAALRQKPTMLVISMTTNDVANGFGVNELMANLNLIRSKALAAGVEQVIITTSHPRKINATTTKNYMLQRDQVLKAYGLTAVNFFDPVADADNLFKAELLSEDGIHPNDKGHRVLYEEMKKVIILNLLH